jgi:stage V sporulation protein B
MPAAIGISVMAHPIYNAVYGAGDGGALLRVFGPASFFCCMQLYTTAMLQASGLERAPMITFPLGGALMLVIDYILVGNREIGILGSPYGTLACFAFITLMNFIILAVKSPARPRLIKTAGKPLVIAGIMGVAAFAVHGLLSRLLAGNGRGIVTLRLLGTVAVAAMVYLVLIVYTKTITKEDLALVPRGDKLAKLLRL